MNTKTILVIFMVAMAFWLIYLRSSEEVKKEYYESGKLMAETNYRYGKPEGITMVYYESGALRSEANFTKGKLDGINKLYYESGTLGAETNFKNGLQDGITMVYYENGTIKYIDTYKNGQHIDRQAFDPDGKLISDRLMPRDTALSLEVRGKVW